MAPPPWAGKPPVCDHGQPRDYQSRLDRDGTMHHLWACAAEGGQCPEQPITKMEEVK